MNKKNYALAIDLGGTTAKCALIYEEKIIDKIIIKTKKSEILENIYFNILPFLEKYKLKQSDLIFIGITICGLIDYENGISIWAGNLEWNNYGVVNKLKELFQIENIYILNDSKSATYGEYVKGIKKEKSSMLLYTIGTGLGGGVILNHELYFGNNTKLASEPGHSGGFQSNYQCNCNLPGCIEGLSSATGIEKELNKNYEYFSKKLNIQKKWIEIKDIYSLFQSEDKKTIDILTTCLTPLAKHIAVSLHLMDFEIVVIGGGPSALGKKLITIIKDILRKYLLPSFYKKLDLRIAKLGNDAGIWGIYYWAIEKLTN
ncbi:ROK family protein [Spiroplasma cantharicola]|uniref:Glucokinase n=1 Tax=Spiroplasma cantharicola TaxID=362837 RepID=A0A0M4JTF2_9MOLU|nr:ROK family protein [Spiroplasma cantharicola]ALD66809.1 glucokinase [Spiroplasma cantharicola]